MQRVHHHMNAWGPVMLLFAPEFPNDAARRTQSQFEYVPNVEIVYSTL